MLGNMLAKEFAHFSLSAGMTVVAWSGFAGRVVWFWALGVGLTFGAYGAIRMLRRYRRFMAFGGYLISNPLRDQVTRVALEGVSMRALLFFAALAGLVAWGVRAFLF